MSKEKVQVGLKKMRSGLKRPEGDALVALSRNIENRRNKQAVAAFEHLKAHPEAILRGPRGAKDRF